MKGDSAVLRLLPQLEWFSGADEVGWGVGGAGERGRGHSLTDSCDVDLKKTECMQDDAPTPFPPCFPQLENCSACLSGELRGTISQ